MPSSRNANPSRQGQISGQTQQENFGETIWENIKAIRAQSSPEIFTTERSEPSPRQEFSQPSDSSPVFARIFCNRAIPAASYGFHPEALFEYAEATNYYLHEASMRVANRFIADVESAAAALVTDPTRWRVVEDPEIRRYVFTRFPFVIYYRCEQRDTTATGRVLAAMPRSGSQTSPGLG